MEEALRNRTGRLVMRSEAESSGVPALPFGVEQFLLRADEVTE
jgi:hypothetical protein